MAPSPVSPRVLDVESDQLFRLLVSSVRDYAIFMLDPGGHVATWNAGAQRFKGYTADEIIGQHFSIFYPEVDVRAGKCEYELEGAARDGRFEDEGWRVRKDGTQFWANVVITAVRDETGALIGFGKVTRDLTDRKRNEEERAARLAAEHASRTKDEFLAMLGHELRNPLAPIVTALQLIRMRGETGSPKELAVIERQVHHMIRLVDDLLDVSRIARGKVDIKRRRLDVRDPITKALEIASPLFEQRRHHVAIDLPREPVLVDGDDARLAQIVTNLLTNAARYTPARGHISVRAQRRGAAEVAIDVADDGSGIEPELLPRIFELFVQGRQGMERAGGGLGLGLTLARSLVAMHGGTIEAHSEGPGHGSTFTITLPCVPVLRPGDAIPTPAPVTAPSGPIPLATVHQRILVVDDNEDARELLAEILGALGHDVRSAGDGPDALAAVAAFTPDVAILDLGLPVMDGYELAAQLRARVAPAPVRLIALSGYGQPTDRARSRAAGFDRHLVKPVDTARLVESLTDADAGEPR